MDDTAGATHKMVAAGAQLDAVAGVDEAIRSAQLGGLLSQIPDGIAAGADAQGALYDCQLHRAGATADQAGRKSSEPVADLECNTRFRGRERVRDARLRVSHLQVFENRLIRDLAGKAHVRRRD